MGSYLYLQCLDGSGEIEVDFDDVFCIEAGGDDQEWSVLHRRDGKTLAVKHKLKSLLRRLGCVGKFETWYEGMASARRLQEWPGRSQAVEPELLAVGTAIVNGRVFAWHACGADRGDMIANRQWAVDALREAGEGMRLEKVLLIQGFPAGPVIRDEFDVQPDEPPAANDKES